MQLQRRELLEANCIGFPDAELIYANMTPPGSNWISSNSGDLMSLLLSCLFLKATKPYTVKCDTNFKYN